MKLNIKKILTGLGVFAVMGGITFIASLFLLLVVFGMDLDGATMATIFLLSTIIGLYTTNKVM